MNQNGYNEILDRGYLRVVELASKYGYKLVPSELMDRTLIDKDDTLESLVNDKYSSVLYDGGNPTTTMMRLAIFKLARNRPIDINDLAKPLSISDEVNDCILDGDDIDEIIDADLVDSLYCQPAVVREILENLIRELSFQAPTVQSLMNRVREKNSLQVVDTMINICLPLEHKDKKVKNLLIYAPERSGKSAWRELLQLICAMVEFRKYSGQEDKNSNRNYKGCTVPCIGGPNVRTVVDDIAVKSELFMRKSQNFTNAARKMPRVNVIDKEFDKNPKIPYISGMSAANVEKMLTLMNMYRQHGIQPCFLIDEADFLFSSRHTIAAKHLDNIITGNYTSGLIFQTATPSSLLLREEEFRIVHGLIEVFDIIPTEDYTNEYNIKFELNGTEKFVTDEHNNIHECTEAFLYENLLDDKYYNHEKKLCAFPIFLNLPCSAVKNGTMTMAKRFSAKEYGTIDYGNSNPLAICFCGTVKSFIFSTMKSKFTFQSKRRFFKNIYL